MPAKNQKKDEDAGSGAQSQYYRQLQELVHHAAF
jgi:hypothetical protein